MGAAAGNEELDATDVTTLSPFAMPSTAAKNTLTLHDALPISWSYTLDDNNAAVQALNTGGTLHELVTVATADGTTQVIDVTINGANDAAVIIGKIGRAHV